MRPTIFLLLFGTASTVIAALSPEERALQDWTSSRKEEMITLLEKSARIDGPMWEKVYALPLDSTGTPAFRRSVVSVTACPR